MESDLPLIEMDEEDDDALIPLPNQTPSKSSFSFSPLLTNSLKDMEKASSSSVKATNNKENINSNNVQVPKLGMKPMPMKTRNKGAGYNLRKSLAWDRAFFTDEGILDPYELTLITGINDYSRGGELPVMSEEGSSSCSSSSRCRFEPNDSEDNVEVVSKEIHGKSCILKGKREKTCSSMAKHDSLAHHKVTHKAFSIDRTNRVRSKVGGCSAHIAASSLKRPENPNILKTSNKDPKLPKIPTSKPGSCISATTKGSIKPAQLGRSLIPRSTTNVQKDVGLKSSIKNQRSSQSKAKTSLGSRSSSAKELPKRTLRNLTNSSSKAASSTKSRLVQVDTTNNESETVQDRSQLVLEESTLAYRNPAHDTAKNTNNLTIEAAKLNSSGHCYNQRHSNNLMISNRLHICESKDRPASPAAPHHMNIYNTGVYSQNIEPARPSGLRLPSPSLRFFDQTTASESVPLQRKENQQSNSNMSSNRKIDARRPPAVPTRTPMKISNIEETICSELATPNTSCCNSRLSISPNYMENTNKRLPYSNMSPDIVRENEPMVDMMVQYERRRSGLELHKVSGQKNQNLRYVKNLELDKITCKGDEETRASHIEEDKQQNLNDVSTFIEHILTRVDGHTTIMQDPTQTSREQSHTEKSDLEKYSVSVQHEKTGQENDIEVVDVNNEPVEADTRCNIDRSLSETKVSNSITSSDSLNDEAQNGRNINAMELKSCVCIMDTVQGHDDTDSSDVLSTAVETPVLYNHPSVEGIHIDPNVSIENKSSIQDSSTNNSQFSSEGQFANCSQEQGQCANACEINDDVIQQPSGSVEEQNGVDVALTPDKSLADLQLGFREFSPLSDDNNRSCLSRLAPEFERSSGTAYGGDDALVKQESVLDIALCTESYPQCLENMGIDMVDVTIDAELHDHSIQKVDSSDVSGKQLEFSDPVIEKEETFNSVVSCSSPREVADDVLQEKRTSLDVFLDSEQVLTDDNRVSMKESWSPEKITDLDKLHNALESFVAVPEESISHGCLLPNSDANSHIFTEESVPDLIVGGQHNEVQGFVGIEPPIETHDSLTNGQSGSCGHDPSESNSLTTCVETTSTKLPLVTADLCSVAGGEESMLTSSHSIGEEDEAEGLKEEDNPISDEFQREFDNGSDLKKNKDATVSIEQVLTNNNRVCMKRSLSPEKIVDLDKLHNGLESFIAVPDESNSHGRLLPNSDASSHIFHMEQASISDLRVGGLPNELQGFSGIKPPIETYDYFTNGESGSCAQDPSESNSLTTCVETTSTTLPSVNAELCSVAGGDKSMLTSSHRIGEEDSAEGLKEEDSPMVDDFHHEFDSGSDLKKNKDATVSIKSSNNIKRPDNSLVIHPPNAVPFSDEWLAAIEAAGEAILSMKCGAVQHSPPDKSVPEPSPWSPVKKAIQLGPYDCTKYMNGMPSDPH
ncbi:uncharacterized protein [Rutidosis leptorrhynchoides]|uniref:uncharacterized protein n=1 Tax=Rutidosis leptorrhynchoides TaxID=125765 RepID=UPI003A9962DA